MLTVHSREKTLLRHRQNHRYLTLIIKNALREKLARDNSNKPARHKTPIVVLYYRGILGKLNKIGNNFGVWNAFSSQTTLRRNQTEQ